MVVWAHKTCSKKLINEELDKIKIIFWALSYPSHIDRKTVNNRIFKLEEPIKQEPSKCLVYLTLPYLLKDAMDLKKECHNKINSTFRCHYQSRKSKVIYKFNDTSTVCILVERIRRDQQVTKLKEFG